MIITIIWIVTIRLGETRERVLDSSCKVGDLFRMSLVFSFLTGQIQERMKEE